MVLTEKQHLINACDYSVFNALIKVHICNAVTRFSHSIFSLEGLFQNTIFIGSLAPWFIEPIELNQHSGHPTFDLIFTSTKSD